LEQLSLINCFVERLILANNHLAKEVEMHDEKRVIEYETACPPGADKMHFHRSFSVLHPWFSLLIAAPCIVIVFNISVNGAGNGRDRAATTIIGLFGAAVAVAGACRAFHAFRAKLDASRIILNCVGMIFDLLAATCLLYFSLAAIMGLI